MKLFQSIFKVTVVLVLSAGLTMAGEWKVLGERKVNRMIDKDIIHVGSEKGTFKKIKFRVKRSGVHFMDVKVYFSNGEVFDVSLKRFIKAGHETRVIDLPGKARKIKKVVFWYDTKGKKKGKGLVKLLGKKK